MDVSRRLQLEFVGPISAKTARNLVDVLDQIKQSQRPTLLYLKTRAAALGLPDVAAEPAEASAAP